MSDALKPVFEALRETMLKSSSGMDVATDTPTNLVLKTRWNEPGKKEPAWFGAVQQKKQYVSYHLMPLYALPELREGISPELLKRMHGKSCFNFKQLETDLFNALEALTGSCAAAYSQPVETTPH